jgi:hypothetical protein
LDLWGRGQIFLRDRDRGRRIFWGRGAEKLLLLIPHFVDIPKNGKSFDLKKKEKKNGKNLTEKINENNNASVYGFYFLVSF